MGERKSGIDRKTFEVVNMGQLRKLKLKLERERGDRWNRIEEV